MATCRFPGCDGVDDRSALPPGWILVQAEIRGADPVRLTLERRRWLLCPLHAHLLDALGAGAAEATSGPGVRRLT